MEVTIHLDEKDYIAMTENYLRRFPGGQRVRRATNIFILGCLLILGVSISDPFSEDETLPLWLDVAVALVLLGLLWGLLSVIRRFLVPSFSKRAIRAGRNLSLYAPTHMRISESGIDAENEFCSYSTRWVAIETLLQTDSHIFVGIGSYGVLIIPKRCFGNAGEAERFFSTAQDYWKTAQAAA